MAAGTATGGTHSMGSASGGHPQVELATHPRTRSTLHKALTPVLPGLSRLLIADSRLWARGRSESDNGRTIYERVDVCALHLEASLGATFVAPLPL